jgi:hypothetical protein
MSAAPAIRDVPATASPAALPVDRLADRCAEELADFARQGASDGRHGHQLFRRALVERDPRAWEALAAVYGPCLDRWARAHPLFIRSGEEAAAVANQALAQLWLQVGAARFAAFPTLACLLGYLRRCVDHLVIDAARARARERARAVALRRALASRGGASATGGALARVEAAELWALVRAQCRGEQEERLAYGALVLGLPPRELLALDEGTFGSVAAINAGLTNLRRRLRRSPALRQRLRALDRP